jgi:ATP-dependent Clp protease protease subunit
MRDTLNQVLARHTGQDLERIAADTERDFFMGSEAAEKYGIVDGIVKRKA